VAFEIVQLLNRHQLDGVSDRSGLRVRTPIGVSRRSPGKPSERKPHMHTRRVLVASALVALLSTAAFAQGTQPAQPAKPAAPAATTSAPTKPATTGAATTAPVVAKTNLNTATMDQLDKLPHIGAARSKAIVEARAKDKFKNWEDFVARKVVPTDAAAAIKDVVSF
jgi:DNA uptake protein ComE-like DNA-binding protein